MAEPRRFAWVIGQADAGLRLDRFLTAQALLGTRSQVSRLITAGHVLVAGRPAKPGGILRTGDCVSATTPSAVPVHAAAEAIPLDVLYEDEVLLAINKPPGMVVHPAPGHWSGTLVSALLYRWPEPGEGLDSARLGIVHRLDKDTSGVLLIARTASSLAALGRQFRAREVHKQYLALVVGVPKAGRGVIDQPIGRHPAQRKKMAVRPQGRLAATRYEVIERLDGCSLVRAFPETGRTHQIRVHLAAIGNPIVGDPLYGGGRAPGRNLIGRQALHAEAIEFLHPSGGTRMRVEAPLAEDFTYALGYLRAKILTSPGPFSSVSIASDGPSAPAETARSRPRRPSA